MIYRKFPIIVVALVCAGSLPSGAVIVAGTDGTGNNNATKAGLDSYISGSGRAAFAYWNNLIRVSDASGVYLGHNSTTGNGWVLSANHVITPSSISLGGSDFSVVSGTQIGASDLKLYQISGAPDLPAVPLTNASAIAGDFLIMAGRGFTADTDGTAPFAWGTPGEDPANGMRWGTNTVESVSIANIGTSEKPNNQPYIITDFDGNNPAGIGTTAYDAQAANGDSGGGLFLYRNGAWQLGGIGHFVTQAPVASIGTNQISGVDPAEIGDRSAYSDVFSHLTVIQDVTGTLIPEPASAWLVITALPLIFRRKRS